MASGWILCVWLPCIGVVSGYCCKEVYRYLTIKRRARKWIGFTCKRASEDKTLSR